MIKYIQVSKKETAIYIMHYSYTSDALNASLIVGEEGCL